MSVAPHRPKGPPLTALRAFESAARLGSFAAAAEELLVTPGAVSQHVRSLEELAGYPLFERRAQGVRLTAAGQQLAPHFAQAFDAIGDAVRHMRDLTPNRSLQIAALPSVAQLWLHPRLAELRTMLGDISISVTALDRVPNLDRDFFDVALDLAPLTALPASVMLARDDLIPVCAPALADRISSLADINNHLLLHDDRWSSDWEFWSAQSGVCLTAPAGGLRFSLYAMAVAEALSGAGILMGHTALIGPHLSSGALVPLADRAVPSGLSLIARFPAGSRSDMLRAAFAALV